ncbi:ParB/RepB/Spo0J family partition protein [Bradyrhizobium septentrionale]|uniref:ParB/RepB/Spo0J family partition protein n=1 Tax=Bradyrhizobium septentrionale TaxID=1404411 RepID=A0ABZ2PCP7_9BRAD
MQLIKIDPRALKENPERMRQTKSTPQADALLLATIKAVGIVQPPVITPDTGGGNGYVINAGHRRVKQAIAAGLEEIDVLVDDAANDNGAMRSMVENIAREALNPVDQWRAIERLVALAWTEEAIGVALALPVRQIRKLRLLANVLPAMLDHMAKGDMPDERQLRTIAAASLDEQKEVWKKQKPSKPDPQVSWWSVAQALQKTRMFARHASFGDDLAKAYGIYWVEDLFAPADEDSRYTTDVEAFLGAQQEWMTANLPKKGIIAETTSYGEVKLPPKAEQVHGKPAKSDCTAMYLDRDGRVQTVHYRMPAAKNPKGKTGSGSDNAPDDVGEVSKPRPDVTRKGVEMIGDYRTDALREALIRAPIEDDTLMALLILAFAGQNVSVTTGSGGTYYGHSRLAKNAAALFDGAGKLSFDMDTLRVAARTMLVDVFSCRENATNSGIVARVAGEVIGADTFLPNMGTEDFLSSLSRPALEASCKETPVLPRQRVKDTRAALVEHFKEGHFVHPAALFAPDAMKLSQWLSSSETTEDADEADEDAAGMGDDLSEEETEAFREAAE